MKSKFIQMTAAVFLISGIARAELILTPGDQIIGGVLNDDVFVEGFGRIYCGRKQLARS